MVGIVRKQRKRKRKRMKERMDLLKQLVCYIISLRNSTVLATYIVEDQVFKAGFTKKEWEAFLVKHKVISDTGLGRAWHKFGCYLRVRYYQFPEDWEKAH